MIYIVYEIILIKSGFLLIFVLYLETHYNMKTNYNPTGSSLYKKLA